MALYGARRLTYSPTPQPDIRPNGLYTGQEVAAQLGVHISTIYLWRKNGQFPLPLQIGPRTVRWTGQQIVDYVAGLHPAGGDHARHA
ncbi:helix-turn-helix transcriptional regulator [Yoonia sp. 67]|uniref:helix-turn-helix transcriptional regulator n=1 Tax=unclassified Yoonia TaxID=2629118 RepID=UPI003A4C609C